MEGGNAFDAAIATNAVLNVIQPHACGIGGDAFFLLYKHKRRRVESLNASGRSSHKASIDFFNAQQLKAIPSRGVLAAINVPGCVSGWFEVFEKYGSMSMERLLHDAISVAEDGFPVSHQLSQGYRQRFEGISRTKGMASNFCS